MAQAPDQIRQDIASTRAELARDVDTLADRTLPNRMARRRWTAVRDKMRIVRERVMGAPGGMTSAGSGGVGSSMTDTAQDMARRSGEHASEAASQATETVQRAPEMMRRQTQGNPLAAGIIAFGAGLLAASLLPETQAEKQAGQRLQDQARGMVEQVREPLTEAAQQAKEDVSSSMQQAAEQVKETARGAASTTGQEAASSAQTAAQQTHQAAGGNQ